MPYLGSAPKSGFISNAKERYTGITTAYVDLSQSIASLADVIVWVNFVKQDSTNLTLTSSTRITLGATLTGSDIVEIAYLGKAVATQTPGTGTVTNDMLAGSITESKLAGSIGLDKLSATGTKSSSTFLRGDNTFAAAGSSVGGATGVDFNDNVQARFGTGNDFSIQHNASNTILAHTGTGDLQIRVIDSGKACIFYDHDASNEILKLTDTNGYLVSPPTAGLSSGQSPNVYINNSGTFKKSTSALKYKKDVRDLESIDISSFRPVRYKSNIAEDETNEDFIGFIADEFHDAGLTELVSYGDNNEVEGFNYDRVTAVLTKALQDANKKIEELETRIKTLEDA